MAAKPDDVAGLAVYRRRPDPLGTRHDVDHLLVTAFSCAVRVLSVEGQDFGALAVLAYEQGGGIDIDPCRFEVQITEDAAQIVKPGALLTLTLSDQPGVA